mmetsp:Transcript_22496/g.57894  ORF Transcript_22496/g.57894 Transcript_22496/m.57894 type:complete len:289 (-) Transcript_22496:349-1215(-)
MAELDAQTLDVLSRVNAFSIQQRVSMKEAATCGCCEAANKYDIWDETNNTRLMLAEERSSLFNRCCCAPGHSLIVDVHAVDPQGEKLYQVMTVERLGCCMQKPCLGCFACAGPCTDKVTMYAGGVEGEPGSLEGGTVIGTSVQPTIFEGSVFTPMVRVMDRNEKEVGMISGPCCIGGCSEFCVDSNFKLNDERALIQKVRPKDMKSALRELATDSDSFRMEFKDTTIDPTAKANMIGSMLLLDYMFFERDVDMLSCEDGQVIITFFNFYCCGCLCPCQCRCGGGGGGE